MFNVLELRHLKGCAWWNELGLINVKTKVLGKKNVYENIWYEKRCWYEKFGYEKIVGTTILGTKKLSQKKFVYETNLGMKKKW